MIRSEKMILKKTDEIANWLSEATAIYNQALYHLRQEFFNAKLHDRKPDYSKIDLYKIVKETESWRQSNLDINAKQYVLRKVNDSDYFILFFSNLMYFVISIGANTNLPYMEQLPKND